MALEKVLFGMLFGIIYRNIMMAIKFDVYRQHDFSFRVFVVAMGNLERLDRVTLCDVILVFQLYNVASFPSYKTEGSTNFAGLLTYKMTKGTWNPINYL